MTTTNKITDVSEMNMSCIIQFRHDCDFFPDYFKVKNLYGSIHNIETYDNGVIDMVVVQVKDYLPELKEWDNCIIFKNETGLPNEVFFSQTLAYYMDIYPENFFHCHKCMTPTDIDELDAKDDGTGSFTILECEKCYGAGWQPLNKDRHEAKQTKEYRFEYPHIVVPASSEDEASEKLQTILDIMKGDNPLLRNENWDLIKVK